MPVCDEELQHCLESAKTEESLRSCPLLSLTDGYAFDLYQGIYCILTNKVLIRKQKENTYMKEYPALVRSANKYTAEAWEHLYLTTHENFGRTLCKIEPNEKVGKGCLEDNMKPTALLFEVHNYCENKCKVVEIKDFFHTGEIRKTVNCSNKKKRRIKR